MVLLFLFFLGSRKSFLLEINEATNKKNDVPPKKIKRKKLEEAALGLGILGLIGIIICFVSLLGFIISWIVFCSNVSAIRRLLVQIQLELSKEERKKKIEQKRPNISKIGMTKEEAEKEKIVEKILKNDI